MQFPDGMSDTEKLSLAVRRIKMLEEDQDGMSAHLDKYDVILSALRISYKAMCDTHEVLMSYVPKR